MRRFKLTATPTEKRQAWLRHLASQGPDVRTGRGVVPCHCMRLGWTRWVNPGSGDFREELTDEGRATERGEGKVTAAEAFRMFYDQLRSSTRDLEGDAYDAVNEVANAALAIVVQLETQEPSTNDR